MRHHGWLSLALTGMAFFAVPQRSDAFYPTGPDDELFVTGSLGAQYNSNLFLSHNNQKADEVFDIVPGLEWDFGKNAVNQGSLSVASDVQLFASDSSLDTTLPQASFKDHYDDSKTKLTFDANYQELDQATRDVRLQSSLIKRDYYHADGSGEVSVTDKSAVSVGAIYDETAYRNTGGLDWTWINVPLKYYYRFEPKLDLSAGISYQDNMLGKGGIDSDEYFLNVGARGELAPKLTGEFSVGLEDFVPKSGKTQHGLGLDSSFDYAYSPKTTINLSITDGFGYSPLLNNSSYRNLGANLGFISAISEQWKFNGQIGYSHYSYISSPERDDFYNGNIGVSYIYNAFTTISGSYGYSEDASNITFNSFTDNTVSFTVRLRF